MNDFKTISLDAADGVAVLTLNQPATRNSLSKLVFEEMLLAIRRVESQRGIRALVLTGAGHSFCSGGDLDRMMNEGNQELSVGCRVGQLLTNYANPVIESLQTLSLPVVAAVNGATAGAGVGLALAADIVVAARSAYFLVNFLPRLGLIPDLGGSWFLPHSLGRAKAIGLMLLGDRIEADQAEKWGMIWSSVADDVLMVTAMELARRLANLPSHAALEARRAVAHAAGGDLINQLRYEVERQQLLLDQPSFAEGVRAFFEKREPRFRVQAS